MQLPPAGLTMQTATLNLPGFLHDCRELIMATDPLAVSGKLTRVAGLVLEASGLKLAVLELMHHARDCLFLRSVLSGHCVDSFAFRRNAAWPQRFAGIRTSRQESSSRPTSRHRSPLPFDACTVNGIVPREMSPSNARTCQANVSASRRRWTDRTAAV